MNSRKIFVITVLILCIIAINFAVYFGITHKSKKDYIQEKVYDTVLLTEEFTNIFDNQINYQNSDSNIEKKDNTQELVYTSYINQEKVEKYYELNVNIPCINIDNETANKTNEEINSLFYNKAIDIINKKYENSIYSVKYKAYLNDNILSLIISATLKEGNKAQRLIIKTYNYNLTTNENVNLLELLSYRNISKEYAQNKINEEIKLASAEANRYKELGYNKYSRDENNNMYNLANTTVYFLGENKSIYIIYPYGNSNYTSELDLIII